MITIFIINIEFNKLYKQIVKYNLIMSDKFTDITIKIGSLEPLKKYQYNLDNPITSVNVIDYIYEKILWIGKNFDSNINLSDCEQIEKIYFDAKSEFDGSLDLLPPSLIHLEFHTDTYFSQSIDNLPQGLEILILGHSFVESVDNLPESLQYLHLTGSFNTKIDNLPAGLEILYLGEFFNQTIDNLPICLKKLTLSNNFNKSIDNLPSGLVYLEFESNRKWIGCLDNLPKTLQILKLEIDSYNYTNPQQTLNTLPPTIKYVEITTKQNITFDIDSCLKNYLISKKEIERSGFSNWLNRYEIIFL
jgi:hypothetical protein